MHRIKSIKLYFFSILNLLFLSFRSFYFRSKYYNKRLISFIPDRIFYNPSTYLSATLIPTSSDFYKANNTTPKLLWQTSLGNKREFENLHSFLWLAKVDRKNSKIVTKDIIKSWIDNFFNYNPNTWEVSILANRIIAWSSNTDITLEDAEKEYKEKFFLSLVKQSNFLVKNLNNLFYDSKKIICCSAIILSGMIFRNNDLNYKIGIDQSIQFEPFNVVKIINKIIHYMEHRIKEKGK